MKRELWPGRWEIKVIGQATEGEAHVRLYQIMGNDEIERLYNSLGLEMPSCPYEASQVENTFSTEEMTIIKQFFSTYPNTLDVQVTQAYKPIVGRYIDDNGVECTPAGMSPFGDMYCSMLSFPDLDALLGFGIGATITHFVTPDNKLLSYDGTRPAAAMHAKEELERDREETRRKLRAMIDTDD